MNNKAPPQPDYAAIEREKAAIAEQQRIAAEQRQREEEAQRRATFNTNLDTAYNTAYEDAIAGLGTRGFSPDQFGLQGFLDQELNRIRGTVPDLFDRPENYFAGQNVVDAVVNNATQQQRNQFGQAIDQFAPSGFAQNRVTGTLDDSVISQILREQFDPAQQQIQRAFDRGMLNPIGFQSANDELGRQRSGAEGKLQDIGGGVLQALRDRLSGIGQEARQGANTYQLGSNFDPSSFQSRINSTYDEGVQGLEGSIRNALGGENLFDLSPILARGGTDQGITNDRRGVLQALQNREQDRNRTRGLSTQGTY